MPTQMTQEELVAQSLQTARELRNSLLRYLGMMTGACFLFINFIGVSDPNADMSMPTIGSLPGFFAVALCILTVGGFLGSILQGYRLWKYIQVFRL